MKATYSLHSHRIGGGTITITLRNSLEKTEASKIVKYITDTGLFEVVSTNQQIIVINSCTPQCWEKSEMIKLYKDAKKSLIVINEEDEFRNMLSKRY